MVPKQIVLLLILFNFIFADAAVTTCGYSVNPNQASQNCLPSQTCKSLLAVFNSAVALNCETVSITLTPSLNYTGPSNTNITLDTFAAGAPNGSITSLSISSAEPGAGIDAQGLTMIMNSTLIPHLSFQGINFYNGMNNYPGGCLGAFVPASGTLTVMTSTFTNCKSDTIGGGLFAESMGSTYLDRVVFTGNQGSSGGGVYLFANQGTVYGQNLQFFSNSAQQYGGGMNIRGAYPGLVNVSEGCLFRENVASYGGGVYTGYAGYLLQPFFLMNKALVEGGGLLIDDDSGYIPFTVERAQVHNNTAVIGGGVSIRNINTALISGNVGYNTATNGSGIYLNTNVLSAGGVCSVNLVGTNIQHNNAASYGGGLYCSSSCAALSPETQFANNIAGVSSSGNNSIQDVFCDGTCQQQFCSTCSVQNCDNCKFGCASNTLPNNYAVCLFGEGQLFEDSGCSNDSGGSNNSGGSNKPVNHHKRNVALGITFGLVLPLLVVAGVAVWFFARRRNSYHVSGTEERSLMR